MGGAVAGGNFYGNINPTPALSFPVHQFGGLDDTTNNPQRPRPVDPGDRGRRVRRRLWRSGSASPAATSRRSSRSSATSNRPRTPDSDSYKTDTGRRGRREPPPFPFPFGSMTPTCAESPRIPSVGRSGWLERPRSPARTFGSSPLTLVAWLARASSDRGSGDPTLSAQSHRRPGRAGVRRIFGLGRSRVLDVRRRAVGAGAGRDARLERARDLQLELTGLAGTSGFPWSCRRRHAAPERGASLRDHRPGLRPRHGRPSAGRALAQGDRYGFFSFPGITGDSESPEVNVKIVEAEWAGHYWVFWGSLTSLRV